MSSRSGGPTMTICETPGVPAHEVGEHAGHGARRLADARAEARQRPFGARGEVAFGDEVREIEEIAHGDRRGRGLGAVVVFLEAQQHRGVGAGRVEPAAFGVVPEELVLPRLELERPVEPLDCARRLEQLERAPRHARVVLAIGVDPGLAVAPATAERPGRRRPTSRDE